MSENKRGMDMILIGAGGFSRYWQERVLPEVSDIICVKAVADPDKSALNDAGERLNIPRERRFTDAEAAIRNVRADCAAIVVPAAYHEGIARMAMTCGLHVLSEKPMSDSMERCLSLANFAKERREKLAVTMSRSFEGGKPELARLLKAQKYGKLNYLAMRLDTQKLSEMHELREGHVNGVKGYFLEGVIHAIDLMQTLSDSTVKTVYANVWRPEWEWRGYPIDMSGFTVMTMQNGVRAMIEQSQINASSLDDWGAEYVRAECESATLILHGGLLEVRTPEGTDRLSLPDVDVSGHARLIRAYELWIREGGDFSCSASNNLHTCAATYAAIASAETGCAVNVDRLVERCAKGANAI